MLRLATSIVKFVTNNYKQFVNNVLILFMHLFIRVDIYTTEQVISYLHNIHLCVPLAQYRLINCEVNNATNLPTIANFNSSNGPNLLSHLTLLDTNISINQIRPISA